MYLILVLGLGFVACTVWLASRGVALGRFQSGERVRAIGRYTFQGQSAVVLGGVEPEVADRPAGALAERLGAVVTSRIPHATRAKAQRDLVGAGIYDVTAEAYYGYRVIAAAAMGAVLVLFAAGAPNALTILLVPVGVLLAWRSPGIVVEQRARTRCSIIDRDLPELIDLLVVSIEAGIGLGGALQMTANRIDGPLGDELRLMLQEQSMGLSAEQSLGKLLDRVDTPAVRSFVRSLQQGERLGTSIGQILRGLAVEMRTRRRQSAEERAQKAPVKILFPLVFLIFPSIFVVLLGPSIFIIGDSFN